MNKTVKIVVTQEDIDKAGPFKDIHNCFFATCLKNRGFKGVYVGPVEAHVRRWLIFPKTYKIDPNDNKAILSAYHDNNLQSLLGKEITLT